MTIVVLVLISSGYLQLSRTHLAQVAAFIGIFKFVRPSLPLLGLAKAMKRASTFS